jgi:hypothetical protein
VIQGTATIERAQRVDAPATDALELPGATLLQVIYEFSPADRDALFPPALHPVNPPCVAWSFLHAPVSVHGAFTLFETRLLCRSGLRTRGYQIDCVIDNDGVAHELASRWGFVARVGDVGLDRRYDGTAGRVDSIEVGHRHPVAISTGDLQYTASMHAVDLADRGVRLLQVERSYDFKQAERGTPFARGTDGTHPVSASSAVADVILKAPRFACRPDVTAFEGTEALSP